MEKEPLSQKLAGVAVIAAIFFSAWILPPLAQRMLHLCPVRPNGVPEAQAIAAWGRKYGVSCNVCHVAGYKLTGAGQKFLRNGHQMPGAEKEANLSDYLSLTAKLRAWAKSSVLKQENKETGRTDKTSFEAHAFSLYSGGPLDKGFSYFGEMYMHENEKKFSATASEKNESDMGDWARSKLAELYLMYNHNFSDDAFVTGRVGRIMPWLLHLHGGGARLEYSRPLPLTSTTAKDNPYRPFSRQYGAGVGGGFKDAFLEAGIVNGTGKNENIVEVETDEKKDVYVTLDYTFDSNGSMLGGYYYKGYWPMHWFAKSLSGDKFHQYGILGNYTFKFDPVGGSLIGAWFIGNDRYMGTGQRDESNHRSQSYYVEAQGHLFDGALAPYVRYEWFDLDLAVTDNEKFGPVVGVHVKPFEHGRFVLEWSRYTERISQTKRQADDDLTLEMQFMF